MKKITLKKDWLIKAPRQQIYKIVSDFEAMPKNFPKVAYSLEITKRDGNTLFINAQAKSFGKIIPVKMKTELLPNHGFISDNNNEYLGMSGHEEFFLSDAPDGTKIDYKYELSIYNKWLGIIAGPLFKIYSMKAWEKAFINRLKKLVE